MNMKTVYLNNFMSSVVTELERNGQYSTAHVCGSVLRSVMVFDGDGLLLSGITGAPCRIAVISLITDSILITIPFSVFVPDGKYKVKKCIRFY